MRITDIKQQVKRSDRYSIYIDGKYAFSLSANELLLSGLRPNQELDELELANLTDTAKADKAYDRALNFIMIRPRSEWEMRLYLKRKGYEPELVDKIVQKLQEHGHIDDTAFARAWVNNRRLLKAISKRRLQQELRAKRISDDIVESVLGEDETDEREVLRDLIARKRQQSRYHDKLKLMQYLSRQGYSYDDIKDIMSENET